MTAKVLSWNANDPAIDPRTGMFTPAFLQLLSGHNGILDLTNNAVRQPIGSASSPVQGGGALIDGPVDLSLNAGFGDLNDVDMATTPPTDGQVAEYDAASGTWLPKTPASGGGGGYSLISEVVMTSGQLKATFTAIPATYRKLIIEVYGQSAKATSVDNIAVQFNGDTTSNYAQEYLRAQNGSVNAGNNIYTNWKYLLIPGTYATAGYAVTAKMEIPNYADTTFFKSCLGWCFAPYKNNNLFVYESGCIWQNTAAINQIDVYLNSGGAFVANSKVQLYGVT